ncbi:MAG TPA: FAD-dependent oxidoreductase [Acetivibrio sp.]|uniref:NAD(P)/FAD-dependent oxidoreductase n=1 Tax=Acetivibrio sp. TaxID=1872092 RepID=UPI002C911931|nr:hypothetical protein [Acetivibrio sp.]HOM03148.1 FAD-dependent oxidoreductase [Acetivibrio sp.]
MKLIVRNLKLSLDDDIEVLKKLVSKKIKVNEKDFKHFRIVKESIDARKKPFISFVYSVMLEIEGKVKIKESADIQILQQESENVLVPGSIRLENRPVVIGTGPAGLFAGLILAQNGYRPLILERGESVEKRTEIVNRYWEAGELDPETNVQFGEGGAGTFSDGKLTTRINDRRCSIVLEEFYKSGAHEEILYKAKPHIGSDVLKRVVSNMRNRIIEYGGEVRFNSKVTSIIVKNGKICGIIVNDKEEIPCDVAVLAIGHSARDTFKMLLDKGVEFVQKPFSIGVRIEHPQEVIDRAQYGEAAGHPKLGASDYQLFQKIGDRTAYSFCMCPGGIVVASASEPGMIVTNGMSEFARDRENANSALVVSVEPEDFGSGHPLAGIDFQRKWEKLAFAAGGSCNWAPVQRLGDFVEGRKSTFLGIVKPSYTGGTNLSDIHLCLPSFVTDSIKKAIPCFDSKIKGFGMKDAVITGVETRTSSPVRIPRGDSLEAIGIKGLYPAGEGAGYAGGIVSAAVDGIRIAERIISTYSYE